MDVPVQYHNKTQSCIECGKKTNGKGGILRCRQHYSLYKRRLMKDTLVKKLGGKCAMCNGVFHNAAFDFHHIKDKTKAIASMFFNSSEEKILKEIEKCILLCSNCHRTHHANQF